MNWLTRKVFGNGHGMGAPFFDQTVYWLVDTSNGRKHSTPARFYTFLGGFGAQLTSFEWACPKPGTRRKLAGMDFVVFSTSRGWVRDPWFGIAILPLMWSVSWSATHIKAHHGMEPIRAIKSRLGDPMADYMEVRA